MVVVVFGPSLAVVIYYRRSVLLCVVFLVWQGPLGN